MNPLSIRIADERANLFVGRQHECQQVEEWLTACAPPTKIVAVTGMGGIGKSTLLLHLLHRAQSRNALTAWVDGRTCYRTPRGFLEALPEAFEEWRRQPDAHPPLVLAIDNYEELQVLEGWLREVFLTGLPETGLLVMVASRANLMSQWLLDPGWRHRVTVWALEGFTPTEIEDFLVRRHWPKQDIRRAHQLALGHPLSLAVAAEARSRFSRQPSEELAPLVRETLSARLLREITDPDLQPLVDALTLMAGASLDRLRRVLQQRITARQYQALKALSFVKQTAHGEVSLHDIVVMHLFEDFRNRDPAFFERLRNRAIDVLLADWDQVPRAQQGGLAQQLLWLCRDIFQEATQWPDISSAADLEVSGYRPEEHSQLRSLIREWRRQILPPDQLLALFDAVAMEFPESIRVTRAPNGEPVAVFVSVALHATTLALLEKFHPQLVSRLMALELGIRRCAIEEAKAGYNAMTGIALHHPRYSPEQILGVVARDQMSMQAGVMGLLVLVNPELKSFLRAIGYQSYPFPVSRDSGADEELFVLDLRQQHFGQWIRQIVSGRTLASPEEPVSPTDVRYFLAHWNNDTTLQESRLATRHARSVGAVKRLLQELVDGEPKSPLTLRDQEVLKLSYWEKSQSIWQHAEKLHISRATFYRYQEQALVHLSQAVSGKLRQY